MEMSTTINVLKKTLDVCALRQRVLAANLANANTPGYVRNDVNFKEALADAMKAGASDRMNRAEARVVKDYDSPMGPDGNNVSTQKELGGIIDNSLLYGVATKALSSKYSGLRNVISGK